MRFLIPTIVAGALVVGGLAHVLTTGSGPRTVHEALLGYRNVRTVLTGVHCSTSKSPAARAVLTAAPGPAQSIPMMAGHM